MITLPEIAYIMEANIDGDLNTQLLKLSTYLTLRTTLDKMESWLEYSDNVYLNNKAMPNIAGDFWRQQLNEYRGRGE